MAKANGVLEVLRPDRYVFVAFAFFIIFPVFMDFITPDVVYGYAGGTVDPQGNVMSSYEGGNAPQYQLYYPVLYPLIVIWYLAVLSFGLVDNLLLLPGPSYYLVQAVYFYLLAVALVALLKLVVAAGNSIKRESRV